MYAGKIILVFIITFLFILGTAISQSVGLGTQTPHPSAVLDLVSPNKGLLLPRLTQAARLAIANPPAGLVVYQTDATPGFFIFNGTEWSRYGSSELERIIQGGNTGWRLLGRDPSFYGTIGQNAVDFSNGVITPSVNRGATGANSAAFGVNTTASGNGSFAAGRESRASGFNSFALGQNVQAKAVNAISVGGFNDIADVPGSEAQPTDRIFQIGNGTATNNTSNAMTVLRNGAIGIGIVSPHSSAILDIASTQKGVLLPRLTQTDRFSIANPATGLIVYQTDFAQGLYIFNGTQWSRYGSSELEKITQESNQGWRLLGKDPAFYGIIGQNAVDFSHGIISPGIRGAIGGNAAAFGVNTTASGNGSFAAGRESRASGFNSFAFGQNVQAKAVNAISIGGFNDIADVPGSEAQPTDRIFQIGNGTAINNTSNAMTVLRNGNVGIGQLNPTNKMHVSNGNIRIDGMLHLSTNGDLSGVEFSRDFAGKQADAGKIQYGGFGGPIHVLNIVGGGTNLAGTDRTIKLWSEGGLRIRGNILPDADNTYIFGNGFFRWSSVWSTNGSIQTSDANLKTNIQPSPYGLNEVMQLNPVQYNWKEEPNGKKEVGLLAQEVLKLIPAAVVVPEDGSAMGINYSELIPVLIKAIQEQQNALKSQAKEIESLKNLLKK